MLDLFDKINESVAFIRKQWTETAKVGIVLGTGLGPLVEKIDIQASIDYGDIPNFPKSTALSHNCLLYTSPSPRDQRGSRMPSSA